MSWGLIGGGEEGGGESEGVGLYLPEERVRADIQKV